MKRRNFTARRPMVAAALFAGIVLGHSVPGLAATSTPYSGTPVSIPGTVQAENFDNGGEGVAYHDTTKGNAGGKYRTTDVDIESNSAGGYNLGWMDVAEWLNYTVKVATAGNYTVQLRVASPSGASLHLKFNSASSVSKGVAIPATGGWQNWTTVSVPVTLGAGTQQMTLLADTAGFNVDYVTIVSGGSGGGSSSGPASTPYTGTPVSLPGTVQAENFDNGGEGVAYHDTTAGNAGAQYRATDVDIEAASAGGYDIGWIVTGEWLKYTVNVTAAGSYTVQLRVASPNGASMHVGFNAPSNVSVSVSIPATGDWHTWTTVSVPVTLGAGTQVMTLTADASAFNIDYLIVASGAPAATVTSTLTSPASGASYMAPATMSLGATASTSSGSISKVEFFNGSALVGTAATAPYAVTWSNVAAGTYTLSAKATDSTGVTATSSPVTVTVASPAPPPPPPVTVTSTLTSPADGSSFLAPITITLAADASTSSGTLTKVEFFDGSTLIGTAVTPPYAGKWNDVPAGSYTISAKATNSSGVTATSAPAHVTVAASAPSPLPQGGLVQSGNLVYQGAFRVPDIFVPGKDRGFDYGGTAPAFNPAHNSLFLVSHMYDQMTAEISIPAPGTGSVDSLPQATALHGFMDATEGKLHNIAPDPGTTVYVGGQHVAGGQLLVTAYTYYGGGPTASHFSRSTNLNTPGVVGPVSVGPMGTSFYSGYMGAIPSAWQGTFGGTALTGDCCLSVISRTSYGPAAFAFNPATLTGATPLVYYDSTHPTLGDWGVKNANPYFNGTTQITGIVFPEGTSSVLFFGIHGLGVYCYGEAATCGDPEGTAKGDHAYPYVYYVWAYDAHDLAAVRAGTKQPWDVKPYATWALDTFFPAPNHNGHHLGGATYDAATGRIFVSQQFGDGDYPLIHVFTLK